MKSKTKVAILLIVAGCPYAAIYTADRITAAFGWRCQDEKITVLVARHGLRQLTQINRPEQLFAEVQFNSREVPAKAIRAFAELKGRHLDRWLCAGEPVTAYDLVVEKQWRLNQTMALNISRRQVVGEWLPARGLVNIAIAPIEGYRGMLADTILENIRIVEVDYGLEGPQYGQDVVIDYAVRLRVTPEKAERLALAQKIGTITLIPLPLEKPAGTTKSVLHGP